MKHVQPNELFSLHYEQVALLRPTERGGGVTGASAPGPGGPKGARRAPSKKI